MTARIRPLAVTCAALALFAALCSPSPARAQGSRGMTELRIELSTTSDWATISLQGITARVQRTVDASSGAKVTVKASEWTVVPPAGQPGTVTIDLVSSPSASVIPSLTLQKGMVGTATVHISSRNGTTPKPVADASLDTHDRSSNSVTVPIDAGGLDIGGLVVPPIDSRRLTMAFYYPWFGPNAPSEWSIAPDKPVGAFDTNDPAAVAKMVDQAIGAGINGFVVSWDGAAHERATDIVLAAAAARPGFVAAPLLEMRTWVSTGLAGRTRFDAVQAAAATRSYFSRAPAGTLLRVGTRPVLMVFGMWDASSAEWNAFRTLIADLNPFIIGDRTSSDYPVDGFYNYDPNNRTLAGLEARNDDSVNTTRLRTVLDPTVPQLLWAATASPGFDNRASAPLLEGRWTDRAGGQRYDQTWALALDSQPDWVLITSWNEWYEQTHIAPGTLTGTTALTQTARWTSQYRTG